MSGRVSRLRAVVCVLALAATRCAESVTPEPAPPASNPAPAVAPGPAGDVRFTDVTAASGLAFTHVSGASGRFYFVEQWGAGAAFFDYDMDGWFDLFLAQGGALPGYAGPAPAGNRLYRNHGGTRFEDVTDRAGLTSQRYTLGVASADFDNDGDPDLFTTTVDGAVLYENRQGVFTDITAASGIRVAALATAAAWVDVDHDGRLDLFVARYQDYNLATDKACEPAPTFPPRAERLEYCGPGRPEVPSLLFRNLGGGRFEDVSRRSGVADVRARGLGLAIADMSGDGLVDIVVASDRSPTRLLINQGGGRFRDGAAAAGVAVGAEGNAYAGMGIDAADYDDDGWVDLVITNYEHEPTTLYRNRGDGTFSDEAQRSGLTPLVWKFMKWGVRLLDLNGDGLKDLMVANGHLFPSMGEGTPLGLPIEQTRKGFAQEAQVMVQRTPGQFDEVSTAAGPVFTERRVYRGAAFADIDNDGDWDAVLTSIDGPAVLLRNDTRRAGSWALVTLEGTASSRDAIGAVVELTAGGRRQVAVVGSAGSYLSDHDRRLLFAIDGSAGPAVRVRWPCGASTDVPVKAGETTVVREAGCPPR